MTKQPFTSPVEDSVPKVDNEAAVGEDLAFQRRWWVFERVIWSVFLVVIVCDLLGLFGQGWLANAKASTPDKTLIIDYERIERASTPSTLTLHFGPAAIRNGHVQVYVSDSVTKALGAQRISPEPAVSAIGSGGISYTFPATLSPANVDIQLQPTLIGRHTFRIQALGEPPIDASVFVVP
jgi:hypothetical protein